MRETARFRVRRETPPSVLQDESGRYWPWGRPPVFQLRVVYDRPSALYMDSRDTGVLIVHKVSRSLLNPVD